MVLSHIWATFKLASLNPDMRKRVLRCLPAPVRPLINNRAI